MATAWTTAIALILFSTCEPVLSRHCPQCVSDASCFLAGSNCPEIDSSTFRTCYGISAVPLDQGRESVQFHANIDRRHLDRGYYEANVTYSVVYELDNEWGIVGDCYKMKLNSSSCILRPMREKETFHLVARTTRCGCMCKERITERRQLPWCVNDTDTPCLEFKDGEIVQRTTDYEVSFGRLDSPVRMDYYMFRTSRIHGSFGREFSNIPFTRDVPGMKFDEGKGEVATGEGSVQVTEIEDSRKKWSEIMEGFNHTCDHMWCFYYRPRGDCRPKCTVFARSNTPICHVPWIQGNYSDDCRMSGIMPGKLPIAVVTIALALLVIALVIGIRCGYSRIKYCRPDFEDTEKQIPSDVKKIFEEPAEEDGGFLYENEVPDSFSISINKSPALAAAMEDANLLDSKDIDDYCAKMCNDRSSGNFCDIAGKGGDTTAARLRLDSGLDEDTRDLSSDENDKVIPTGYSMKVDRSDSGFETIGSVLSSGRSVDSDYNKHPSESYMSGAYCEEAKLTHPASTALDDIEEFPEYAPKTSPFSTTKPRVAPAAAQHLTPSNDVLFVCVSPHTAQDQASDRRALVADSGIYEAKSPTCVSPRVNCVDIFPLGGRGKETCKEASSQRDSSSSCDTGCDTSSYDDPMEQNLAEKLSAVSADLSQKRVRLPSYIQEGDYFPKEISTGCGSDVDRFSYSEGYLTK